MCSKYAAPRWGYVDIEQTKYSVVFAKKWITEMPSFFDLCGLPQLRGLLAERVSSLEDLAVLVTKSRDMATLLSSPRDYRRLKSCIQKVMIKKESISSDVEDTPVKMQNP